MINQVWYCKAFTIKNLFTFHMEADDPIIDEKYERIAQVGEGTYGYEGNKGYRVPYMGSHN